MRLEELKLVNVISFNEEGAFFIRVDVVYGGMLSMLVEHRMRSRNATSLQRCVYSITSTQNTIL